VGSFLTFMYVSQGKIKIAITADGILLIILIKFLKLKGSLLC
jgi:hypothetical protein